MKSNLEVLHSVLILCLQETSKNSLKYNLKIIYIWWPKLWRVLLYKNVNKWVRIYSHQCCQTNSRSHSKYSFGIPETKKNVHLNKREERGCVGMIGRVFCKRANYFEIYWKNWKQRLSKALVPCSHSSVKTVCFIVKICEKNTWMVDVFIIVKW